MSAAPDVGQSLDLEVLQTYQDLIQSTLALAEQDQLPEKSHY
jgi:hypothetical protein